MLHTSLHYRQWNFFVCRNVLKCDSPFSICAYSKAFGLKCKNVILSILMRYCLASSYFVKIKIILFRTISKYQNIHNKIYHQCFSVIIQTRSLTTQPHLPTDACKKQTNKKNCITRQKPFDVSFILEYCCTVVRQQRHFQDPV